MPLKDWKPYYQTKERVSAVLMTAYHARYFACLLTRRTAPDTAERYLPALMSANIDIHPHQIDAAVFACRSQYKGGVILADEEGLGKTVEASIALLQASIEGKKNLLVLCNPPLIGHWEQELRTKFGLARIGIDQAGAEEGVIIMDYNHAYRAAAALSAINWDLCVLDEAHLLANAGLSSRAQSEAIREALAGRPKYLLTATPMQNSLLDLYYLIRFVDENAFGSDPEVFRAKYMGNKPLKQELAARAQMICQRTLKRQALTMQLPRRVVRTILVEPMPEETALSKRMSLYFHREPLLAFPKIQEHYIRLTYWKLLASSPAALTESLHKLMARLKGIEGSEDEQHDLQEVIDMAQKITESARMAAFLSALNDAMSNLRTLGAPEKAVIFSENRRTLRYVRDELDKTGYRGVVEYLPGTQGERALDAFKADADILLATDSTGTGINLSHCACVINYDLPYNVQKLEQRISRCHRYGQKHDVLVINFLDPENRADRRIYALLNRKLKQFDDVFGASEGVLVSRQAEPRTDAQISEEQAQFERDNQTEIERRVKKAEADILAHFDEEVRVRFKGYGSIPDALSEMERQLWAVTRYQLRGKATFFEETHSFMVEKPPYKGLHLSRMIFGMDKTRPRAERYRLDHPLAKRVLDDCLYGVLTYGELTLKAGGGCEPGMAGEMGLWQLHCLTDADYQTHPILCACTREGSALTPEAASTLMKLPVVSCTGGAFAFEDDEERQQALRRLEPGKSLVEIKEAAFARRKEELTTWQDAALTERLSELRYWARDEEDALRARQVELKARIERLSSAANGAGGFAERFALNKQVAELEKERRAEEERLFYLGADIERRRDALMEATTTQAKLRFSETLLFLVSFRIV